jgi:hypothetical protein
MLKNDEVNDVLRERHLCEQCKGLGFIRPKRTDGWAERCPCCQGAGGYKLASVAYEYNIDRRTLANIVTLRVRSETAERHLPVLMRACLDLGGQI